MSQGLTIFPDLICLTQDLVNPRPKGNTRGQGKVSEGRLHRSRQFGLRQPKMASSSHHLGQGFPISLGHVSLELTNQTRDQRHLLGDRSFLPCDLGHQALQVFLEKHHRIREASRHCQ